MNNKGRVIESHCGPHQNSLSFPELIKFGHISLPNFLNAIIEYNASNSANYILFDKIYRDESGFLIISAVL